MVSNVPADCLFVNGGATLPPLIYIVSFYVPGPLTRVLRAVSRVASRITIFEVFPHFSDVAFTQLVITWSYRG